jgi:probable HAF family extracellular repeat protein
MRNTVLFATLALAMVACTSEQTPTEPATEMNPAPLLTVTGGYTAMDLGTLPGGISSVASAINSSGQVAGMSSIANGDAHAFLWSSGVMTDLGTLGGNYSAANAINDSGQVVGVSRTAGGQLHGFLWKTGVMHDLGTLPGGRESRATGIDRYGKIVGGADRPDLPPPAVVWKHGVILRLGMPAHAHNCGATGVSPTGFVIGFCSVGNGTRSELWSKAGVTDLGTLGGPVAVATAINLSRQVVGYSSTQTDGSHPFRWDSGTMTDLTTLGASRSLIPNGINAAGQVVGIQLTDGHLRATVWRNGMTTDLGALPGTDSYAFGINTAGQMVGHSQQTLGSGDHATLWTPK